jgi:predicted dehydrogenase
VSVKVYRAGVIARSGRGDVGHDIDLAFVGHPNVQVVAVADEDEAGARRIARRTGAPSVYASYREMLERERLDLVGVASRWPDCHHEMVVAAAEHGAHIYCEKPLAPTMADADAMLAACQRFGVRLAAAHQSRVLPAVGQVARMVEAGAIGRLRVLRGWGKCDRRGGAQDLMVLGTHVLDLMRFFAGDAAWVDGRLTAGAGEVVETDVRSGEEGIGPVAGDGVFATYGFGNGVHGTLESFVDDHGGGSEYFGLDLVGTGGMLSLRGGLEKSVHFYPRPVVVPGSYEWQPIPTEPLPLHGADRRRVPDGTALQLWCANRLIVADLIGAAEEHREPVCSGADAAAALEMVLAVHESHRRGGRTPLPLPRRTHPWEGAAGPFSVRP